MACEQWQHMNGGETATELWEDIRVWETNGGRQTQPNWPVKLTNRFHLLRIECRTWPKRQMARLFIMKQCNGQILDLSVHMVLLPTSFSMHYSVRSWHLQYKQRRPRNNMGNIQKNSGKLRRQHSGKRSFPLQISLKDTRLQILQYPMNSALWRTR
jgi:hypothetical protein